MVRHSYGQSQWIFPGGGIKKNELPEEAARREIREEIGIELSKVIKIGEFISNKEYKKDTIFVFSGEAKSLELEIDKNEIAEVRWFDTNEPFKLSEYSQKIMSMVKSPISNF